MYPTYMPSITLTSPCTELVSAYVPDVNSLHFFEKLSVSCKCADRPISSATLSTCTCRRAANVSLTASYRATTSTTAHTCGRCQRMEPAIEGSATLQLKSGSDHSCPGSTTGLATARRTASNSVTTNKHKRL